MRPIWWVGRVWLIAAVLKTADLVMSGVRGFKSLSRRQKETVDALRYLKTTAANRVRNLLCLERGGTYTRVSNQRFKWIVAAAIKREARLSEP